MHGYKTVIGLRVKLGIIGLGVRLKFRVRFEVLGLG